MKWNTFFEVRPSKVHANFTAMNDGQVKWPNASEESTDFHGPGLTWSKIAATGDVQVGWHAFSAAFTVTGVSEGDSVFIRFSHER